jgi:hypothetical protein
MAYATINDPSAHFQVKKYTGNGNSGHVITNGENSNLKPDFLWFKNISATENNYLFNSTRGVSKRLYSDLNYAEGTNNASNFLQSFNTDGFTVGTDSSVNGTSNEITAAQWKANGGSTVTNSDGSITTYVQANQTAGFSIVQWTGTGANGSIGHGLGAAPEIVVVKSLSANVQWMVGLGNATQGFGAAGYDMAAGNGKYMEWNDTKANTNPGSNNVWSTALNPSSTVTYVGSSSSTNGTNGDGYIAFCFRSIRGYSYCGTFRGNNNNDGPFIYTGFKPKYVMIKPMDNISSWSWHDTSKSPHNEAREYTQYNSNNAAGSRSAFDILSNGVKIRTSDNDYNFNNGEMLIYAVAEMPLVATNDVIATAR